MVSHVKDLDSCRMGLSRVDDLAENKQIYLVYKDENKPSKKRYVIDSLKNQNPQV